MYSYLKEQIKDDRMYYVLLDEVQLLGEFELILNSLIRMKNVDVGVIALNKTDEKGHGIRKQLEIDFVCTKGSKRYYIQSAYAVLNQAKMEQEQRSLMLTGDFLLKIIITKDAPAPYYNDDGVLVMSVYDLLLNENSLDN